MAIAPIPSDLMGVTVLLPTPSDMMGVAPDPQ